MSGACEFTSGLAPQIARYVAHMQSLGRRFEIPRLHLSLCDRFLVARGSSDLSAETFSAWSDSMAHLTANGRRMRLQSVHRFCRWRRRTEPSCFVPDPAQFPRRQPSPRPYIFSEVQIARLLRTAEGPRRGASLLCRQVRRLAVVLLYTTGLRRGEILRLTLGDYDAGNRVLWIRETKFHKSRIIPLSEDAGREIGSFLAQRRRAGLPSDVDDPLLLVRRCGEYRAYSAEGLRSSMRGLFLAAGVRTATGRLPRIHDLRFTFAVHALSRWYRTEVDVQARLPALATYMGHASVVSTQYYLSFLDDVTQEASERFERHCVGFLSSDGDDR